MRSQWALLSCLLLCENVESSGIQLVRIPPPAKGDNSMMFRHNAYVDSKLRQNAVNVLNHQEWHVRHVVSPQSYASNVSQVVLHPEPLNVTVMVPQLGTTHSTSSIEHPFTLRPSALPPTASGGPRVLRLQENDGKSSAQWDETTAHACVSRLARLDNIASNPSGKSVCYNVQDLNNVSGVFNAEVRIYAVGQTQGGWKDTQATAMTIGLSYTAASVHLKQVEPQKRSMVPDPVLSPLLLSTSQHHRLRRSTIKAPRLLQTLSFGGQINNESIAGLSIE